MKNTVFGLFLKEQEKVARVERPFLSDSSVRIRLAGPLNLKFYRKVTKTAVFQGFQREFPDIPDC